MKGYDPLQMLTSVFIVKKKTCETFWDRDLLPRFYYLSLLLFTYLLWINTYYSLENNTHNILHQHGLPLNRHFKLSLFMEQLF